MDIVEVKFEMKNERLMHDNTRWHFIKIHSNACSRFELPSP